MSKPLEYRKWIYDPVQGYIGVTEIERAIIDNRIFQRLHHIRQLGPAYFVYPGAVHTRFAHSLGTMLVMSDIAEHLMDLGYISDWDEIQKLRIVALLHDIGHFPLSHTIEGVMRKNETKKGHHENLSAYIIKNTEIREKLDVYTPDEITAILLKRHSNPLYSLLVTSDLDVDKIDYLLRDAYFTGVTYGSIDIDRLIRTLCVDNDGYLAVLDKGRQALENLLISRYHMYQTVYYHKTTVAFELMFQRIYEKLMREQKAYDINKIYEITKDSDDFFLFNDNYIWKIIRENSENPAVKELIDSIKDRKPLKIAYRTPALSLPTQSTKEYAKLTLLESDQHIETLSNKSGVSKDWIFYVRPPELGLLSKSSEETAIRVKMDDGTSIPLVADESSIITHLYRYQYSDARVYTKEDYTGVLERAIKKYLKMPD